VDQRLGREVIVFVRTLGSIVVIVVIAVHVQAFEPAPISAQGKASHSSPVARLGRELVRQGALSVPTRADSAPTLVTEMSNR
jgi:hypothetical protein